MLRNNTPIFKFPVAESVILRLGTHTSRNVYYILVLVQLFRTSSGSDFRITMDRKRSTKDATSNPSKKMKTEEASGSSDSGNQSFLSKIAEKRKETSESILDFKFNKNRCRLLSKSMDIGERGGGILYWMYRDQRVQGT